MYSNSGRKLVETHSENMEKTMQTVIQAQDQTGDTGTMRLRQYIHRVYNTEFTALEYYKKQQKKTFNWNSTSV